MEVGVATAPVADLGEGVGSQDVFGVGVYQVHSVFVDRDEDVLGKFGLGRLFHFEKSGPESRPFRDDLQESDLGVISVSGSLRVHRDQLSLPLVRAERRDEVDGHKLV